MSSINRDYLIFPLSCDPELEETEEREIYYKYLDSAFDEPRIHNIGIAGGFGVGKSSLLRSYEKRYLRMANLKQEINNPFKDRRKKDTPRFLYVSMGESQCNDSDNKNETERRILLQIYSRFHKKDIPSSSFEMIHESTGHLRIKTVACCLFLFLVLLLTFFTPLGKLLKATLPAASIIVHYKTEIHAALYLIVIGMAVIGGGYLIYQALTKMYVKTLALKGEKAEVAVERTDTRDYLDQYSMDLVYCLEQTAEKIGHTVVFEDMDRMKTDDVIEIFVRLKEIRILELFCRASAKLVIELPSTENVCVDHRRRNGPNIVRAGLSQSFGENLNAEKFFEIFKMKLHKTLLFLNKNKKFVLKMQNLRAAKRSMRARPGSDFAWSFYTAKLHIFSFFLKNCRIIRSILK